jgi:minor extracellular serine protease Vpr
MNKILGYLLLLLLTTVPALPQDTGSVSGEKFDPFLIRSLKDLGLYSVLTDTSLYKTSRHHIPESLFFNVIIYGDRFVLTKYQIPINTVLPHFVTSRLTFEQLRSIAYDNEIHYIEQGGTYSVLLDESAAVVRADLVHKGSIENIPYTGKGAIIGIIDTGIDYQHPDFRDAINQSSSRIISIWDTTLEPEATENHPADFNYGVEYSKEDINIALSGSGGLIVRSVDRNGHGTHVAGIAGGNGTRSAGVYTGMSPEAEYIIVQVPSERISSASIIDGLRYIFSRADELGRPAVANISLGGHGGSHDGTSALELAIDEFSRWEGQAVVVAAGNSGADRIHIGGTVPANQPSEFILRIPSYQPAVGNDRNDVLGQLWYESSEPIRITVVSPDGHEAYLSGNGALIDSVEVETLNGTIRIHTYGDFQNALGARVFEVYLYDKIKINPPTPGDWKIQINPSPFTDVSYNFWIINSSMGNVTVSPHSNREYTVSIPGTARQAITVGSFISKNRWIDNSGITRTQGTTLGSLSSFSGGGPTRDGRLKPELTAPGQVIGAPRSSDAQFPPGQILQDGGYVILNGTSMAAPHATGVIALLFEANPRLRRDDIIEILKETTALDGFTGGDPNTSWGYGKLDAFESVRMAREYVYIPELVQLNQNYPNPFNMSTMTRISFTLTEGVHTNLTVYDILGRKVAILIDQPLEARIYNIRFNPEGLSSGIYFYRLQAGSTSMTKKMVFIH